jgi:hypothetical protein
MSKIHSDCSLAKSTAFRRENHESFGCDLKNGGPVLQWLWHIKETSLLKAISAKLRSKFAALWQSLDSQKIACSSKQPNKQKKNPSKRVSKHANISSLLHHERSCDYHSNWINSFQISYKHFCHLVIVFKSKIFVICQMSGHIPPLMHNNQHNFIVYHIHTRPSLKNCMFAVMRLTHWKTSDPIFLWLL